MSYELHPLCTLFPRMAGAEFEALKADIAANGLRQPIVLQGGMILDGGNRYRACIEAGIEPTFEDFSGDSLVAFVLSANLHRRHMTPGQQAAIVAAATDWANAQGVGRPSGNSATLHYYSTAAKRAAQSGASERTQKMADKVVRADPELGQQVAHGEVSLPKAARMVEGRPEPKPPKEAKDDLIQELQGQIHELQGNLSEAVSDNESMAKTFEADDRLAASEAENKRLRAEIAVLRQRVNGLLNEKNEAVRAAKMWQRKYDKAVKAA